MGSSSSQESVDEKQEQKELDTNNAFIQNVSEIQQSVAQNNGLPNLIRNFAKLMQPLQLDCLATIIKEMNNNWIKVLKCVDQLTCCSYEDKERLRGIQTDYWLLLLETRATMEILITKCNIQQRNVQRLLNKIERMQQNIGQTEEDKKAYKACYRRLGKWIKIQELNELKVKWGNIHARLMKEESTWKKIVLELSGQATEDCVKNMVKAFAAIIIGAAAIGAIVFVSFAFAAATYGAGAPAAVAAGAIAVNATIMAVAPYAALASSVVVLGVSTVTYARAIHNIRSSADFQAHKTAKLLVSSLGKMITNSMTVQQEISKMTSAKKVKEELSNLEDEDDDALEVIHESLTGINEHLSMYVKQSKRVIKVVDKACKVYIKK